MRVDDPYAELGLLPGAPDEAVKAAWRRLLSRWHPDRNPSADAADRVKRFNVAYEQIVQQRRADAAADAGPAAHGHAHGDASGEVRPDDACTDDGSWARTGDAAFRRRSRTLPRKLRLRLEEAILGCVRELRGRITEACRPCGSGGWVDLGQDCAGCRGTGVQRVKPLFAWLASEIRCADCDGSGRLRGPCPQCQGAGRRQIDYRQQVRLPAGVRDGDVLSADAGLHGGVDLSLQLTIEIEPHPFFHRETDGTLRCEIPVDGYAWLAEDWTDVPTPDGLQQIRLRRGARTYRLRGHGAQPHPGGARADLLLSVTPTFAEFTPPEVQQQLARLAETAATSPPAPAVAEWRRTLQAWAASSKEKGRSRSPRGRAQKRRRPSG